MCLDHNDLNNSRPISNFCFIAKILEKLVLSQVSSYLNSHILYNTCQSAYLPGHSTETALLKVVNDMFLSLNKGNISVLALLDFSSAFDTIDHTILVERRMQPARGRFARFDLDRQMASTFPAHWKVGPAPVFGASQPLEPAEWLALLILKAGDVESNPGPQNRKLPPSALTTQTTTLNSTTHSHATTSHPNQKLLTLLQLNINSITNKHEEFKLLVTELQPDIITIQETKLKKHNKTPQIPTYSAIRTDRANGKGGGLLTYIKHNITFSDTKIPNFINPINTELQIIQLHIAHIKIYTIANIYIPPRNTTSPDHASVMLISHPAFNT